MTASSAWIILNQKAAFDCYLLVARSNLLFEKSGYPLISVTITSMPFCFNRDFTRSTLDILE